MTISDIKQALETDGYYVAENVFTPEYDLGPVLADFQSTLTSVFEGLYAARKISSTYADLPFEQRLLVAARETGRSFAEYFAPVLPVRGDITEETPLLISEGIFNILTNAKLLDYIEAVIGGEIYSSPGQKTRIKLPEHMLNESYSTAAGTVDWHQDSGIIDAEAEDTELLTIWMPLNPATLENGCLMVVPGSHKGVTVTHERRGPVPTIPAGVVKLEEAISLPMQPGSALFMDRRLMHCSRSNVSKDSVRMSLDLRFQPTGQPTGFGALPGFVARSRQNPETELRDFQAYKSSWYKTRRLAAQQNIMPEFRVWTKPEAAEASV